ncbi:MAG: response regulator transcription factor [Clostridiales bacterium]|jgi:DNA-binding response OmpR family regulator|nr:response regulator transcription factor [Clostridiales bacterium]
MKILVADDEQKIRDLLSDFLSGEGYNVVAAADGREALEKFNADEDIGLVILDVMMPFLDGWRVCKEIRKTSRTPIIMLTARTEEMDELESFEKGANDYIPKPFSLNVLLARVRARTQPENAAAGGEILTYHELKIDTSSHTVALNGKVLDLTRTEYELILLLIRNKGRVYSREQLLTQVWGYDYYGGDRTVDTHVGRLRAKLGVFAEKHLTTVRGYGYKLEG